MESRKTQRGRRAAGYTLVEVSLSVLILGLVLGSIAMVAQANSRAQSTGALKVHLEQRSAATIERVIAELSVAGRETLFPDPEPGIGSDTITYLQPLGLAGDDVEWSGLRRLAFEYEVGEADDNVDNNGNGLVDEGRVVLIEDEGGPQERRHVLTRWVSELLEGEERNGVDDNGNGLVDESGFVVERNGETLTVRLTLQRLTADRLLLTRSARTSTRLRN